LVAKGNRIRMVGQGRFTICAVFHPIKHNANIAQSLHKPLADHFIIFHQQNAHERGLQDFNFFLNWVHRSVQPKRNYQRIYS